MATIVISINAAWNVVNFRAGLVRSLVGAGHRVVALTPPDSSIAQLSRLGVEHVPIAIDSKGIDPVADARLVLAYRRALRRIGPDAFLGFTIKPNIYGSLACATLGIPVINNVSGLGTAFIRDGLLTRIVSLLYRQAFRRSCTVFFQNADDRALFLENHLVEPARTALLPGSGIDLDWFAPTDLPAGKGAVFLLISRILRDKGIVEFVDAARIVRRSWPHARFRLLGAADAVNRTAIPATEVDAWVAEGAVEYLGTADDVRSAIAAADVVVLPSYREGLPRTLLEGAAMARPLVATDVPGCREIAREGVNAFLCAPRDAAGLAEAMERMAATPPATRRAMGLAGRQIVEAEYDEALVIERYHAALAPILATKLRA